MKNHKPTVSIGIPAYNEEKNIEYLLNSLLKQKEKSYILEKIIIVSDGSTDKTVEKILNVKSNIVKIIEHQKRLGVYVGQNEIVKLSKSDILILLDADILPSSKKFIENLIIPLKNNKKIGIVGANTIPNVPNNFLGKVLKTGRDLKQSIYLEINDGNNIYLCHGRARAFSKELYKKIKWPKNCPEDSYSYLYCLKEGFEFVFNKKAKVIFALPLDFKEYLEKNKRFRKGKKVLKNYFSEDLLIEKYYLPKWIVFKKTLIYLSLDFFKTSIYVFLLLYTKILPKKTKNSYSMWTPSSTSKVLVNNA